MVRVRALVLALWVLAALAGLLGYAQLGSRLTTSLAVPGTQSARADQLLTAFHENIEGAVTIVVPHVSDRTAPGDERRLREALARVPALHVVADQRVAGIQLVDLESPLSLNAAAALTGPLRAALAREGVAGALVTGPAALQYDVTPVLRHDLVVGEIAAGAATVLLLVALLGVGWAVLVPLVVAALTTATALGVVDLLAGHVLMVLYVPNVVALVGLGLAVDYALLVVHRMRRELARSAPATAVLATMATAGRTVLLSGSVVAIGLATLLAVPVPLVRSLGVAGLVVPVVALASALTLLPALLSLLGARLAGRGLLGGDPATGRWARITRRVVAHPVRVLLASLVALGALGAGAAQLHLTPGSLTAIPSEMPSARAISLVGSTIGPGFLTPLEVLIDTGRPGGANAPAEVAARQSLATTLLTTPGVSLVALDTRPPYVDATHRIARVLVIGPDEFGAPASQALVGVVRRDVAATSWPTGTTWAVGGAPAQGVDFLHAIYGPLPFLVAGALAIALAALSAAFSSFLLALLAVLLDLVTVAVSYGALVVVFREGAGRLLGTYHVGQIEGWVPVFVFAVLFGLSMDYEVFIVARVREAHDRGLSTREALVEGLAETGGVVTSAAAIMVAALAGFVIGRVAGLQELGVGLGVGVALDATIVRGLVLPALVTLLGDRVWGRRAARAGRDPVPG